MIKIMTVPVGEPPLEVRKKWVGETLPVILIHDESCRGAMSGMPTEARIRYYVEEKEALEILARTHPDAANWWYENGFPHADSLFGFLAEEVQIVGELEDLPPDVRLFLGLLEVGVGAHDHPGNN